MFWIKDDSTEGMKQALNEFARENKAELRKKATTARVKVYEIYGVKNQGERMTQFLTDVFNS